MAGLDPAFVISRMCRRDGRTRCVFPFAKMSDPGGRCLSASRSQSGLVFCQVSKFLYAFYKLLEAAPAVERISCPRLYYRLSPETDGSRLPLHLPFRERYRSESADHEQRLPIPILSDPALDH